MGGFSSVFLFFVKVDIARNQRESLAVAQQPRPLQYTYTTYALSLVIERNSIIRESIREQRDQDIVLPFTIKPSTNEQELIRILFKINSSKRVDSELHLFLTKIESLQSVLLKCLCKYVFISQEDRVRAPTIGSSSTALRKKIKASPIQRSLLFSL